MRRMDRDATWTERHMKPIKADGASPKSALYAVHPLKISREKACIKVSAVEGNS
jgi:hypothetical protein